VQVLANSRCYLLNWKTLESIPQLRTKCDTFRARRSARYYVEPFPA
jgi:hypothetical protein